MKPRPIARPLIALALVVALARIGAGEGPPKPKLVAGPTCPVVRVVDGDTIVVKLDGKPTTIRLIGVDTPETLAPGRPVERYGMEATAFLRETLEGKRVRLEFEPAARKTDRYDRTLAYVTTEPGDELVNLAIVEKGFGHAYTAKPFSMIERFREAERETREARRGLWGDDAAGATAKPEAGKGTAVVYLLTTNGTKYHREGCRYLAKSSKARRWVRYRRASGLVRSAGRRGVERGRAVIWELSGYGDSACLAPPALHRAMADDRHRSRGVAPLGREDAAALGGLWAARP